MMKPENKTIKEVHIRFPWEVWEAIVKDARKGDRPPIMHTILLIKKQLGMAK